MDLQIIGHNMEVTPALRESVLHGLSQLGHGLLDVVGVIVRFSGKKKTGKGQSISIEVKPKKGETIRIKKCVPPELVKSHGALYQTVGSTFCKLREKVQSRRSKHTARGSRKLVQKVKRAHLLPSHDKTLD